MRYSYSSVGCACSRLLGLRFFSSNSNEAAAAFLPWTARPWKITYERNAESLDYLDHNMCSILSEDSTSMFSHYSSALGKGSDVSDYVEDPIKAIRSARRGKRAARAAATAQSKRKTPATYIQVV